MFKVGDKVKLNPNIDDYDFKYGRGDVLYEETGTVASLEGEDIKVDFPSHRGWNSLITELIPANFVKTDLQDGDIVTLRNGDKLLYLDDCEDFVDMSGNNDNNLDYLNELNDDMNYEDRDQDENDIMKVERAIKYVTVFERKEKVREMTVKEISEALGYDVRIVKEED